VLQFFVIAILVAFIVTNWDSVGVVCFFGGALGIRIGRILQSIYFMRYVGNSWDFSKEITDWGKVKMIADGCQNAS